MEAGGAEQRSGAVEEQQRLNYRVLPYRWDLPVTLSVMVGSTLRKGGGRERRREDWRGGERMKVERGEEDGRGED